MFQLVKSFWRDINGKRAPRLDDCVFEEDPKLKEKRAKALMYLGDKWIGAKKVQRKV